MIEVQLTEREIRSLIRMVDFARVIFEATFEKKPDLTEGIVTAHGKLIAAAEREGVQS